MAGQPHIDLSYDKDPLKIHRYRIVERGSTPAIETQIGPQASGFYPNKPGAPAPHIHVDEDEVFTVHSGTMGYLLEGVEGVTTTGATMPMGKSHTFWNADPHSDLRCRIQLVSKTSRTHQGDFFFETLGGLAADYGGEVGNINPLQHFLTVHEGGIVYTFVPKLLRPVVRYVAIPLARLVGYKGYYPEYRTSLQ